MPGIDLWGSAWEQPSGSKLLHKNIRIQEGIESLLAKKMVKMIKDKKMKVQAQIQGEQVRVTGKKRDDLQQVIAMLKEADIEAVASKIVEKVAKATGGVLRG